MKNGINSRKDVTIIIIALALIFLSIPAFSVSNSYWFDTDWHFRINYTINNSDYARDYWPVELDINFTDLINQKNKNGTFDSSSIRVVEQNSTGSVLFNHSFQFDNSTNFNSTTNAFGTLTFLLNGTTTANQMRYIYVYFDVIEYGSKPAPESFTTELNYTWDGEEIHVNNSIFEWKIDTLRGENTSGFYEVEYMGTKLFATPLETIKTREYTQLSNGTNNFSFDFRNNATFSGGNIKLIVEQVGNETLWNNPDILTGFGLMRKRYIFYENSSWIKIEQNYTNLGLTSIDRESTSGGVVSLNMISTFYGSSLLFGNSTNPFSRYGYFDGSVGGVGFINYNNSLNSNFYAKNDTALDRIGIHLDNMTIESNESISHTAIMQFDGDEYNSLNLQLLKNQMMYAPIITLENNQFIPVTFSSFTNYSIYNRNDSVLIFANITSDQYNVTTSMNASFDMGTGFTADDVQITMYDDGLALHGDENLGDGIYSNLFNLSETSNVSAWNVTVRAYDSFDVLLNSDNVLFDVTDWYNVTLLILNPMGLVDRMVNVTIDVQNSRDEYVSGVVLNCTYGVGQLTNITDYDNGTYYLNFTAPATSGIYTLNCSALKFNNSGFDNQSFNTETSETMMSVNITPLNYTTSNISLADGDSFDIAVNTTDVGGANAKYVNISLSLPASLTANSTFEACGNVSMTESCIRAFNISVVNGTVPGNYTINVSTTWLNPNLLTNSTNVSFITYVLSNPIIDVLENNVSGIVPDGKTVTIGNFTIDSIGNDNITNITYSVSGLSDFNITFSPENISSLSAGSTQSVSVDVFVPQDYASGNYSGTINVTSNDGGWESLMLNVSIPDKTIVVVLLNPNNYTSSIITSEVGDSFEFTVNMTNVGISDAKDVNITLSMPQKFSSNSTFESCGRVNSSTDCIKMFNITINDSTVPGNYTFNMTSTWINPDLSIDSVGLNFTVQVISNPIIDVSGNISVVASDNSTVLAGNFTIDSIGNDNLTNITFTAVGLTNFTVTFTPVNVSSLGVNNTQIVLVNVTVPFAYSPGNYSGVINVSSVSGSYDTVELNVTVLSRRAWDFSPKSCLRAENPEEGTVCLVTIQNIGNVPVNITINPKDVNYTSVNETNMTILKDSSYVVEFLYNVTNVTKALYYENYTINATETDAVPQFYDFNITLIPFVKPLFVVNQSELVTAQSDYIEFFVNITDRSTTGINWTKMNVTLPNGTVEIFDLFNTSIDGTESSWYFNYSGNMSDYINYSDVNVSNYTGDTRVQGFYNVTIYSQDNTGVIGDNNTYFKIYTSLNVSFSPGSIEYYQGSTGSLYYTVIDSNGYGISNANVTITLNDPNNNTIFVENFTTNSMGKLSPIPTFSITNDNDVGIYNFTAVMTYYDYVLDTIVTSINNATFNLKAGGGGDGGSLEAKVSTTVVWYPNNIMMFDMLFSYAGNMTTPDNMTLTVYDPAGNVYFNISLADANKTAIGYYTYKYAMPMSSASGAYRAELKVVKNGFVDYDIEYFRVSQGGPYDVKITVLPPMEVPRQDYVNFEIYLENMGDVLQDIYLDYWISYGNNTYYYGSEAVLTPPHVNVTIVRNAYIFSNQPLGLTTLNLNAKYSPVQPSIVSNTTFQVIDEDFDIPPPPEQPPITPLLGGGSSLNGGLDGSSADGSGGNLQPGYGEDADEDYNIIVESYNKEINIVQGWTDLSGVRVKNNGNFPLTNITLKLTGIPSSWYNISPENYEVMPYDNSTLFLVEYKIPIGADAGVYPFTITATSEEISTDKMGRLIVFTSISELIKQDIINLKIELNQLEDDVLFSESIGKDVSNLWVVIEEATVQLKLAEDNLEIEAFDDALQNIQIVSGLIKRIKMQLEASSKIYDLDKESLWSIALKALIIIVILAVVSLWWMRKNYKLKLKYSLKHFVKKPLSKTEAENKKKQLKDEKDKVERVLKLLKTEFKEGIMDKDAYDELKQLNDNKLSTIDKKMKKL